MSPGRLPSDVYLTPAVRTIRDDPTEETEVTLLVRLADGVDPDTVAAAVDNYGSYEGATRFGDARVRVPEVDVAALIDTLPGSVQAVETDAVTGVAGDAGEDF